ncbi:MAG TPA: extracellular solute-binding protein [Candidatus Hungatella pullicola]|nr:extracellular solute-binding protein [Candidatus Hungatella pullicola]
MKQSWKWKAATAVVVTSMVLIAGCQQENQGTGISDTIGGSENGQADEDGRIPIEIWTWDIATCGEIHEIFEEKFPQYKIVLTPVESSQITQKLQTTLASGGQVPDICLLEYTHRGKLFQMDIWEDLSAEPYNFDVDNVLDWMVPNETADSGAYVGPEYVSVGALAYKRDLAMEYFGTDDPEELQKLFPDWDSFIAAGVEVQEKSGGKVFMLPSVGAAGAMLKGQSQEPYFDGEQILFNDSIKPILETLIEMKQKKVVDRIDYNSPEEAASCGRDDHIFFECPAWALSQIIKPNDPEGEGRWGLMLPPGGGYAGTSASMGVPKGAKNKEGAAEYIKFFQSTLEGGALIRDYKSSLIPYKPAYEDPSFYSQEDPFFNNQDVWQIFADVAKSIEGVRPLNNYDQDFEDSYALAVKTINATDGQITADELVDTMIEELSNKHPELIKE